MLNKKKQLDLDNEAVQQLLKEFSEAEKLLDRAKHLVNERLKADINRFLNKPVSVAAYKRHVYDLDSIQLDIKTPDE